MTSGTISSSASSTSRVKVVRGDIDIKDALFTYMPEWTSRPRKEREAFFVRTHDARREAVREKELRSMDSTPQMPLKQSELEELTERRRVIFATEADKRDKARLHRRKLETNNDCPERIDVDFQPTFGSLLNVRFDAERYAMQAFKDAISGAIVGVRVRQRIAAVRAHLATVKRPAPSPTRTHRSVAEVAIALGPEPVGFASPFESSIQLPQPLTKLEPPNVYHEVGQSDPLWHEQWGLTPIARAPMDLFFQVPIEHEGRWPVVGEEEWDRPVVAEAAELPETGVATKEDPTPEPRLTSFPWRSRFLPQLAGWDFRPGQLGKIAEYVLPGEVGRCCTASLTEADWQPLSFRVGCAGAFQFVGLPAFPLSPLGGAEASDLRELQSEDDIDGIDVTPKPRQVQEFLTQPLSKRTPAQALEEAAAEAIAGWNDRQRRGAVELCDRLAAINALIGDRGMKIHFDDLLAATKEM